VVVERLMIVPSGFRLMHRRLSATWIAPVSPLSAYVQMRDTPDDDVRERQPGKTDERVAPRQLAAHARPARPLARRDLRALGSNRIDNEVRGLVERIRDRTDSDQEDAGPA
jgi:hypothetical protein